MSRIFFPIILLTQSLLLLYVSHSTSPNRTEMAHMAAAMRMLRDGRFDLFQVNPPLVRVVAGLPVAWSNVKTDMGHDSEIPAQHASSQQTNEKTSAQRPEWEAGVNFVKANGYEATRDSFFKARAICIPLILLGSWFGFRFASELYHPFAGYVFLVLWTFSPMILGWGATICPDVAAASLGIVATYYLWHWLKTPNWKFTLITGLCLGLLFLTKTTWLIAFLLWPVIWLTWICLSKQTVKPRLYKLALIFVIGIFILNAGYLFQGSFTKLGEYDFTSTALKERFNETFLANVPVPLPKDFVQGIDIQKKDFEDGIESYLNGGFSQHGWWHYYAFALAIKEPLGFFGLAIVAICLTFRRRKPSVRRFDEIVPLLSFLGIFLFVSSQTGFSLHPRYVIPALPFAMILVSKAGVVLTEKRLVPSLAVTMLGIWFVASSLLWLPHSMSHFNELIESPRNAPKHLLGSNIDWGQNLYDLKEWHDAHPEARPLHVGYFGMYPLEYLGIRSAGDPPSVHSDDPQEWKAKLKPGWYVLGVGDLYHSSKKYEVFQNFEPDTIVAHSFYIYHLTSERSERMIQEH